MFGIVAAILFVGAAAFSLTIMALMLRAYGDKIVAALMFQPAEAAPSPAYRVRIARHRIRPVAPMRSAPARIALAA